MVAIGNCLQAEQSRVTVWVHGTRLASIVPVSRFFRLSTVERNIGHVPCGLHHVSELDESLYHRAIASLVSEADSQQFPLEHIYMFGWSGELDASLRLASARNLAKALNELILLYIQKDKQPPQITLITHSHGGNVVLNLARVCEDLPQVSFRAILLACPVQRETSFLVGSPLFSKVYNLHSHADWTQVMDPQGMRLLTHRFQMVWNSKSPRMLGHAVSDIARSCVNKAKQLWGRLIKKEKHGYQKAAFFSERHFLPQDCVVQVELLWNQVSPWTEDDRTVFYRFTGVTIGKIFERMRAKNKGGLSHMEFILPPFLRRLPSVLKQADEQWVTVESTQHKPDVLIKLS